MCMYIYVCMYVYIYTYTFIYICIYIYAFVCVAKTTVAAATVACAALKKPNENKSCRSHQPIYKKKTEKNDMGMINSGVYMLGELTGVKGALSA